MSNLHWFMTGCWIVMVLSGGTYAMRMSYEKFCIRTGRPFKSWLGEGR